MGFPSYLFEKLSGDYFPYVVIFAVGFFVAFIGTPKLIKAAFRKGRTVKDMYKKEKPDVPDLGGLAILTGVMASLLAAQVLAFSHWESPYISMDRCYALLIFYFLVYTFALFGLVDDLFGMAHRWKIIIPYFLALPVALLIDPASKIDLVFTQVDAGILYPLLFAPMYVMVVSNLVNMHSGFNGLSCGLSYIVLVFSIVKVYLNGHPSDIVYILPLFGSILAFLYYETFPARIFWGNIGSMMVGAGVGAFIVINRLELFGIVILFPHIINFLMYVVWKLKKIGDVKFGGLRDDGTLIVPNPLTLKWLFPYYFKLTEHQTMWIMYFVTAFFGVLGLVLIP